MAVEHKVESGVGFGFRERPQDSETDELKRKAIEALQDDDFIVVDTEGLSDNGVKWLSIQGYFKASGGRMV